MSVALAQRDERLRARIVRARALVDPRTGERAGAASGAVLHGGRLFVVQDDALSGLWIDPVTLAIERVALLEDGRRLPKAEKPDFEAIFEAPDGALLALGSGGTDRRKRIVRYEPRGGEVRVIDAAELYDALAARLPEPPNIEGATLLGDGSTVRLLHRANGKRSARNASFDVALASLEGGRGPIAREAFHDLGSVRGASGDAVALTFTDATRLGDRVVYLAAAEDCDDAIADGPVVGAAIGVIEADGSARYALLTESDGSPSCRKIEGIALCPGDREAFVVTDPDDEHRASELCTVALDGPW